MSYGVLLKSTSGAPFVIDSGTNYRLVGPISCTSSPLSGSRLYQYSNYIATFTTTTVSPMIYLKIPTTSGYTSGVITGVTKSGNTYTVYILAVGYTPQVYYGADFSGVTATGHGMSVYNASGDLVYCNSKRLCTPKFRQWSSAKVGTAGNVSYQYWWDIPRYSYTYNSGISDNGSGFLASFSASIEAYYCYGSDIDVLLPTYSMSPAGVISVFPTYLYNSAGSIWTLATPAVNLPWGYTYGRPSLIDFIAASHSGYRSGMIIPL